MIVALTHEIRTGPPLKWHRTDGYCWTKVPLGRGTVTVEVTVAAPCAETLVRVDKYIVACAVTDPAQAAMLWARGRPALCVDAGDLSEAGVFLAEAVVPTLAWEPLFVDTDRVGFRAYCCRPDGVVPPWEWDPEWKARCGCRKASHSVVPSPDGTCGFYAASSPWRLHDYYLNNAPMVVVVSPLGRVIVHSMGWRAERYDVCAIVVPLDASVPDDPRIVRARNLPLRAYEITRELLGFAELGEVGVYR
jgi:hypothetical protein